MSTRFTIDVAGRPKNLFTVMEKRNSADPSKTDLNIHFRPGAKIFRGSSITDLIVPPPEESYEDAEIHFSVHALPHLINENVIHRSVRRGNDITSSSSLYTTAMKRDGMFAPIMFVVCGDMKSSRSDLPDRKLDDIVCLAEDVNTQTDQYRFMVVVGPSGRIFGPNPTGPFDHHPSRVVQRPYTDYELIVISSYFNMPALPHNIDLVFGTTAETGPQRGLHWKEVYNLYTDCNMIYANGYFEQIHGQGVSSSSTSIS